MYQINYINLGLERLQPSNENLLHEFSNSNCNFNYFEQQDEQSSYDTERLTTATIGTDEPTIFPWMTRVHSSNGELTNIKKLPLPVAIFGE